MRAFKRADQDAQGKFAIGAIPLERMLEHRQENLRQPEAGGVLVGRHLLNDRDIVVDGVTVPQIGDRRKRFSFFRSPQKHQAALDLAWQVSEGTQTYLGEWHTHPEAVPKPSPTDLKDWRRKLRQDTYTDVLLFVIVGTTELCAWEGTPAGDIMKLRAL